ncbi:hypothetical protein QR680_015579 [Steinernema hermaphroditum]|uniref:Uncharacterized protein n=1 Tax=Steinernema hermaphroditum TaxID=289476 RepID=A0AA39LKV7_9BILA|nr:hypothetical protein QR680_015579 [Steinernema hermaphroditum]
MNENDGEPKTYCGLPITTAANVAGATFICIGIVLAILNIDNMFPDEYRIAMFAFAAVQISMGIFTIVAVFKLWPKGLRIILLSTHLCLGYAGAALFFSVWNQFNIQHFLKAYHWLDPLRPAEDQEVKGHLILTVYTLGICLYAAVLYVCSSVVEACWKYTRKITAEETDNSRA